MRGRESSIWNGRSTQTRSWCRSCSRSISRVGWREQTHRASAYTRVSKEIEYTAHCSYVTYSVLRFQQLLRKLLFRLLAPVKLFAFAALVQLSLIRHFRLLIVKWLSLERGCVHIPQFFASHLFSLSGSLRFCFRPTFIWIWQPHDGFCLPHTSEIAIM